MLLHKVKATADAVPFRSPAAGVMSLPLICHAPPSLFFFLNCCIVFFWGEDDFLSARGDYWSASSCLSGKIVKNKPVSKRKEWRRRNNNSSVNIFDVAFQQIVAFLQSFSLPWGLLLDTILNSMLLRGIFFFFFTQQPIHQENQPVLLQAWVLSVQLHLEALFGQLLTGTEATIVEAAQVQLWASSVDPQHFTNTHT